MYTLPSFTAEVKNNWAVITKEVQRSNLKLLPRDKEIKKGFEAYENAKTSYLPLMILGNQDLRTDKELIQNVGTLATETQVNIKEMKHFLQDAWDINITTDAKAAKVFKKELAAHVSKGAILNESNWWPFRNDCFMLGAIHGEREIHIASKKGELPTKDLLWDDKEKRPRVLGRELIMLKLAGYQRIEHKENTLSIVLAPPIVARNITFSDVRQELKKVKSINEVKEIFETIVTNDCSRTPINKKNT